MGEGEGWLIRWASNASIPCGCSPFDILEGPGGQGAKGERGWSGHSISFFLMPGHTPSRPHCYKRKSKAWQGRDAPEGCFRTC